MATKLLYSEKNEYEEVIMEIFSVNDEKFRKYGKVWNNIECTKLIKGMEHTPLQAVPRQLQARRSAAGTLPQPVHKAAETEK